MVNEYDDEGHPRSVAAAIAEGVRRVTCAVLRIPSSGHAGLNTSILHAQRRDVAARMAVVHRDMAEDAASDEIAARAIEDADVLLARLRENGGV